MVGKENLDMRKIWEEELEYLEKEGLLGDAIGVVMEELEARGWEIIEIPKDDMRQIYEFLWDLTFEERSGKIVILY